MCSCVDSRSMSATHKFSAEPATQPYSVMWRGRYTHAGHAYWVILPRISPTLTDEDMCFLGVAIPGGDSPIYPLSHGVAVLYFNCEIKTNTVHIRVQWCTHSDMCVCMQITCMHIHLHVPNFAFMLGKQWGHAYSFSFVLLKCGDWEVELRE